MHAAMKCWLCFLVLCCVVFGGGGTARAEVIARLPVDNTLPVCRGVQKWEDWDEYHIELLRLALRKSGANARIEPICMDYPTERRRISLLQEGSEINIVYFGTTIEREKLLLPVYVPMFLGTTGVRMLITRSQLKQSVEAIESITDAVPFSYGQALGWPDAEILEKNGLSVVYGRYKSLHSMLALGRFDVYPRSYWQIANELRWMQREEPDLVIADNIAIYYPQPIYFFVSPKAPELRDVLQKGMERAFEDGSMYRLLLSNRETSASFTGIDLSAVRFIRLPDWHLTPQSEKAMHQYGLFFVGNS